ncbi:PxKF domain-containing protein [Dactylosporangium sp. CA-233914]|uniref:PxKF domain-containing protein n=1 Tax=Dactylosporangium sp. CA-233914 TaxID=3239934 RepID=UPI003D91E555
MSSIRTAGRRRRLATAVAALAVALGGLAAVSTPAYAAGPDGETVAMTGPAGPLAVGTSFTYEVTGTAPTNCDLFDDCNVPVSLLLNLQNTGSPATITAATASMGSCRIPSSDLAICDLGWAPHGTTVSATFTLLANAAGTVTAAGETCNGYTYFCATVTGTTTITAASFPFGGFLQPVRNQPTINLMNAGRGVPIKFSLGGDQGLAIFPAGYPASQQVTCDTGAPVDVVEQTVTAGGSSLSYSPDTDTYNYVWKTDKAWAGTCRTFDLRLTDGTDHYATFRFN